MKEHIPHKPWRDSVMKSGWERQTDEGASRQVKLSEKGEHKIEGDAANKDVAIEGLWTVQNTTQAPALVIGNGSKNEMHTGDLWPVVTQTIVFNLRVSTKQRSPRGVRSHSHTPSGHHRLDSCEMYPEKLFLVGCALQCVIMDVVEIPGASTNTSVRTKGPETNATSDAILRDTSARPDVRARPAMPPMQGWSADDSGTIVTSCGGTSDGDEVAVARRHVAERLIIEADPVPTTKLELWTGQHETSLLQRNPKQRRSASDGPKRCTNHAFEVVYETDTSAGHENGRSEANNLIFTWNVTSHADERWTCSKHGSIRLSDVGFSFGMMTRLEQARSLCSWQCGQVEPLWAYSNDINKKHRELRHGAEHDSIEQHSSGLLAWTLGVGMADGPRALTWNVPCALVVAADTNGWSAIVV